MKSMPIVTLCFGIFFLVIEFSRRGFGYFAINATTMIEDLLMGVIMIVSALVYRNHREFGTKLLIAAWAYAVGGMFVPFAAHFEAYLRGATFRADHPHEDLGSVILKGAVWLIAIGVFTWTMAKRKRLEGTDEAVAQQALAQ